PQGGGAAFATPGSTSPIPTSSAMQALLKTVFLIRPPPQRACGACCLAPFLTGFGPKVKSSETPSGALWRPARSHCSALALPATDGQLHREVPALDRAGPR